LDKRKPRHSDAGAKQMDHEILLPLNFVFLSNKIPEESGVSASLRHFAQDDMHRRAGDG
jgi:hypothetical protein